MYWPGGICDTDWLNAQVFSQQYEKNPTGFNVTQVPIANLFTDLTNGTLPFYSFIMCWNDVSVALETRPKCDIRRIRKDHICGEPDALWCVGF